jgi:transposase
MIKLNNESVELSNFQRQALEVILLASAESGYDAWREKVILHINNGLSVAETAQLINIEEKSVTDILQHWTSSLKYIQKSEQSVINELTKLTMLINQLLSASIDYSNSLIYESNASTKKPPDRKYESCIKEQRPVTNALLEVLHNNPKAYGINRSSWTLRSLASAFQKHYGIEISKSSVGRFLKDAGYSWKKSQRVLTSSDPDYEEKVRLVLRTLQNLKSDEVFYFIDEMGPIQVKKHGGRLYAPKGKTPTHPQFTESKGSILLYGALSATTNQITWLFAKRKNTETIIKLIEILFNQNTKESKIYITWDAASWHSSKKLIDWLDDFNDGNKMNGSGPLVEIVPLPSNSQFLNVIEAVFSAMKKAVIHNSDYRSVDEMEKAISNHFKDRNEYFKKNPKRVGKKIWEIDFFQDYSNLKSGNYRDW